MGMGGKKEKKDDKNHEEGLYMSDEKHNWIVISTSQHTGGTTTYYECLDCGLTNQITTQGIYNGG